MKTIRHYLGELSPMKITAVLSIAALFCVVGYQAEQILVPHTVTEDIVATTATSTGQNDTDTELASVDINGFGAIGTSSATDIDHIGSNIVGQLATHYVVMQQTGTYTPEAAAQVATDMAQNIHINVGYAPYATSSIKTDPDISYKRMIKYRSDLQVSLAPLLKNNTYEMTLLGMYTQTKDPKYLTQLKAAAQNYHTAASSTAKVVVPADAVSYQLGILNAMQEFATTLDAITTHIDDPITTATLLTSYNQAEQNMFDSFNALSTYYTSKHA